MNSIITTKIYTKKEFRTVAYTHALLSKIDDFISPEHARRFRATFHTEVCKIAVGFAAYSGPHFVHNTTGVTPHCAHICLTAQGVVHVQ
mmetsp:Transcript_52248/g.103111  ORF Transcript_52248/g.103111 Transcript_52248/m.103111 type:complete len:89 (-) Transcript_52248:115-381(-)